MKDMTRRIRLNLQHDEFHIPPHTEDALNSYLNYGYASGFLTELLSNNLMESFNRADNTNTSAMRSLAWVLRNRLPRNKVWGDSKIVERFGRMSEMKRQEIRDQMVLAGWAEYE